jgi:hypothetical protein
MDSEDPFLVTFLDMMKDAMPDKVIANFVFVAEVVSGQDNELSVVTSNGMTPWLAGGMLSAASEMIADGIDSSFDEEEGDQ